MHVVVTAHHPDDHVGPVAIKLVCVFQVRGIAGAVLVGQHERRGTGDIAQDLLLLVERHHGVESQLEPLVAGKRVLVIAVNVVAVSLLLLLHSDQSSAGQNVRGLVRQLGRPARHHLADRLVERVRRWTAAALPSVQRLYVVYPAPDRGQRVFHVHRPRPHCIQHDQAPNPFGVDTREPRAQLPTETVPQVDQLGPAEVIDRPLDGAQIVGELQRHTRREMVRTAVTGQVDAHVMVAVGQ